MRFLIDVVDLNSTLHSKYSRVLRMLVEEAEARGGIAVEITASSDMIMRAGKAQDRRWDFRVQPRKSFGLPWVRALQFIAGLIVLTLTGAEKCQNLRRTLVWYFAYSIETFSPALRKRFAACLDINADMQSRILFRHWLAERGIDFGDEIAQPTPKDVTRAIQPGKDDILILAGLSWRYDMSALKSLKARHKFKIVCLIYDLLPLQYPSILRPDEYRLYKAFLSSVQEIADLIAVANEDTAKCLQSIKARSGNNAHVETISLGKAALEKNVGLLTSRLLSEGLDRKPFLLCVSPFKKRKHLLWLYALCTKLREDQTDFPILVIAGQNPSPEIVMDIIGDPRWATNAIFIDTPTDDELSWLYSNTLLLLYPSFEGGTGLAVMEALKFGCPCITSDASSLREINGTSIKYLPRDETLWSNEILRIISSVEDRQPLEHKSALPSESDLLGQIVKALFE